MKIKNTELYTIKEPLAAPFGFKGRYIDTLWHTVVKGESDMFSAACPTVQSVLWSDERVFEAFDHDDANEKMQEITKFALSLVEGKNLMRPDMFLENSFSEIKAKADEICGLDVRQTFVLNSLVGFDIMLWTLWAKERGITRFDGIIPEYAARCMTNRNKTLAQIPLVSYGVSLESVKELLDDRMAVLKIKIGYKSPEAKSHEEDMEKMLEWDKLRLSNIHELAKCYKSDLTDNGNIKYYLDANGRYDSIERIEELLDHAEKIGAIDDIILLEEPFAMSSDIDVSKLGVVVAADESAHSAEDVKRMASLGYRAVALKPIAKTMSETFRMLDAAEKNGMSCFCADLTVPPLLVLWNMQFASRIKPLKGLKCGCIEVNGDTNYSDWESMKSFLPKGASIERRVVGRFSLDDDFFSECKLFAKNGYFDR